MIRDKKSDCMRFEAIEERMADGGVPTAEDLRFRDEHMAVCSACRALGRIEEILAYRGPKDSPVEPLDEISLHRNVAEILAKAEEAGPLPASFEQNDVPSLHRRWLALGGLASALAATLAVVAFWPNGRRRSSRQVGTASRGRLLYRSGRVVLASHDSVVESGSHLVVRDGRAGLELPCKAGLVAFDHTEVRLDRLDEAACELFVSKGRVFVAVQHLDPPVSFVVHTAGGTASVRGTAFSLSADGLRMDVSVLRGLVAVDERHGGMHMVAAGQGYESGRGSHSLGSEELAGLAVADSGLRLALGAKERGTVVVQSKPEGATVFVDGLVFGSSPLEARIQSGLHVLRLSWPDGSTERLTVDVPVGGRIAKIVEAPKRPGPSRGEALARHPDASAASAKGGVKARRSSRNLRGGTRSGAETLMAEARRLRARGRWREAAARYEKIVEGYRGQAVAATAQVLLGWVLLRHLGRPAEALARFESYLVRGGSLAQEAAYGKILALRRLGRTSRERAAIQAFLKRYPKAIQVPALERRLKTIAVHRGQEDQP